MSSVDRPKNLLQWMREWCIRPRVYLVGEPDHQTVNVSYLRALITAYDSALVDAGHPSLHDVFRQWLFERRPELREKSKWFGEARLPEYDGDHATVVAQILDWVEEFLAGPGAQYR